MMSAKNLRDSILQMAVEGKLVEQREEEGTAADLLASIRGQRAQLVREKKAKPLKGGESVIWAYRSKCVDYVAGLPLWQ